MISDCRFPNEIKAIKDAGGKIVWVQRGELPDWYELAVKANQGHNHAVQELKMRKIHASETAWVGTEFDVILDNNSTIDDLYKQANNLIVSDQVTLPPDYAFLGENIRTVTANSF